MPAALLTREPAATGFFGPYGGQFVPEVLRPALLELEAAYADARCDPGFQAELEEALATFTCRPTPLYFARRLSECAGTRVYLKREDLNHTGAHKINNTLGQILLARRMGKRRIIAETGAGQHGVATAAAAARLGLRCEVHMGEEDIRRQRVNVQRMELMGARVIPATCGDPHPQGRHQRGHPGLGGPTSRTPTTSSAAWSAPIPTRPWSGTSSP